jgi:hypothetical protein
MAHCRRGRARSCVANHYQGHFEAVLTGRRLYRMQIFCFFVDAEDFFSTDFPKQW